MQLTLNFSTKMLVGSDAIHRVCTILLINHQGSYLTGISIQNSVPLFGLVLYLSVPPCLSTTI